MVAMNTVDVNTIAQAFDVHDASGAISGIKNDFTGANAGRNADCVTAANNIHARLDKYKSVLQAWADSSAACAQALQHSASATSAVDDWTKVNIANATLTKG